MSPAWILASWLVLHGVVDQVDAGVAAVEWEGREIGYLPASLLPPGTGEGDAIELRVRSRPLRPRPRDLPAFIEVPSQVRPRRRGLRWLNRALRGPSQRRRDADTDHRR